MGVRLTGISTPIGGVTWEYTEEKRRMLPAQVVPDQKIKVFISSIRGVEKYDTVRMELKNLIEATQLADVYLFEDKVAATLPVGAHYRFALEDSDICIFLMKRSKSPSRAGETSRRKWR